MVLLGILVITASGFFGWFLDESDLDIEPPLYWLLGVLGAVGGIWVASL